MFTVALFMLSPESGNKPNVHQLKNGYNTFLKFTEWRNYLAIKIEIKKYT